MNKLLNAVAGAIVALLMGVAHAAPPEPQSLRYSVDFRGHDAGEVEVEISRDGDHYLVRTIAHPSLLASMFIEPITAEARFDLVEGELRLLDGRETVTESGELLRSFAVDHAAGSISFSDGDPLTLQPGTRLDADAFPLSLVALGADAVAGTTFYAVNPKRARLFESAEPVMESVEVAAGAFDTMRVDNTVPSDRERVYSVWLRTGDNPVPVKIVTGRSGKATTMELLP